jgi:hypothetical protein
MSWHGSPAPSPEDMPPGEEPGERVAGAPDELAEPERSLGCPSGPSRPAAEQAQDQRLGQVLPSGEGRQVGGVGRCCVVRQERDGDSPPRRDSTGPRPGALTVGGEQGGQPDRRAAARRRPGRGPRRPSSGRSIRPSPEPEGDDVPVGRSAGSLQVIAVSPLRAAFPPIVTVAEPTRRGLVRRRALERRPRRCWHVRRVFVAVERRRPPPARRSPRADQATVETPLVSWQRHGVSRTRAPARCASTATTRWLSRRRGLPGHPLASSTVWPFDRHLRRRRPRPAP